MKFEFVNKIKTNSKKVAGIALVVFCFMLVISLFRNASRIRRIDTQITERKQQLETLKKENQILQEKLKEVESVEFIEKKLRDDLGLAKEGEIVVVLPDDEILRSLAPKYEEEEDFLPDPTWKKWVNLFI